MKKFSDTDILKALVANLPGHVWWKDKNLKYVGCNNRQARQLGFENFNDILGLSSIDAIDKELPQKERIKLAKAIDNVDLEVINEDKEIFIEEPIVLASGMNAIYYSHKIPLHDEVGNVTGLLGISIDITDKKRAEALQKELEFQQRANTMLKLWSSAIAHEMRTPLTALSMNVGTLMTIVLSLEKLCTATDGSPKAKRKIEQLKTIPPKLEKTIDAANHFIDMTLMKSRAGDEEIEMNLVPLSMADEIKAAIQLYPFRDGDEQFVTIDTKLDFKFMGESNFFHHVIFNLLKNALHYVKQADKGSILITTVPGKTDNILIFKDTGPGMSQENVDQLFKPFFSKTKHGTGVGLSLCHNLMGAFGGSISCTSVEGEFTEFKLMFPVVISDGS